MCDGYDASDEDSFVNSNIGNSTDSSSIQDSSGDLSFWGQQLSQTALDKALFSLYNKTNTSAEK